jgi:hypothetical protein
MAHTCERAVPDAPCAVPAGPQEGKSWEESMARLLSWGKDQEIYPADVLECFSKENPPSVVDRKLIELGEPHFAFMPRTQPAALVFALAVSHGLPARQRGAAVWTPSAQAGTRGACRLHPCILSATSCQA